MRRAAPSRSRSRAAAARPNRRRLLASAGSLLLLFLAACATAEFDRFFEEGRFEAAARAFDADSALHEQERALYRAGLVHGLPESPAYEPARAQRELERLLTLYPRTEYREEATRLLSLLLEVARLERTMEDRMREARSLAGELEAVGARAEELERQLFERERDAAVLRRLAERLDAQLREREAEIEDLRRELERLKEIDLGRRSEP